MTKSILMAILAILSAFIVWWLVDGQVYDLDVEQQFNTRDIAGARLA